MLAKRSYDLLLVAKGGLAKDGALDIEGIRTVLALRGKYGVPQKTLTDPMKYVDLSYQEKALGKRLHVLFALFRQYHFGRRP